MNGFFFEELVIMDIKTVGVIGAGTMGNGIAHVFAKSGYEVILCDIEDRFVQRGIETISKNLEREAAKGKISMADREAALKHIRPTTQRSHVAAADLIVE